MSATRRRKGGPDWDRLGPVDGKGTPPEMRIGGHRVYGLVRHVSDVIAPAPVFGRGREQTATILD